MVHWAVVILILTVALKPDSVFVSGPCALIKGTAEPQGNKQVVFKVVGIAKEGQMDCRKGHSKYSGNVTGMGVLPAFALAVTVCCGFGYAIGEIQAGVHLEHFDRDKKDSVLVQWGMVFHTKNLA